MATSIVSSGKSVWGFSPQSIPGLQLWLDAADQSSMVVTGTQVVPWNDKSGNGFNLNSLAAPDYTPPVIGTPINGLNTLFFSAAASLMRSYVTPMNGATNFYWVGRIAAGSDSYFMMGADATYDWHAVGGPNTNVVASPAQAGILAASPASQYTSGANAVVNTGFSNVVFPLAGQVSLLSVAGITGNTRYLGVCYDRPDGHKGWCGDLGEVLIFSNALTTQQHQQVEGYLAAKWGLGMNLPATHPYSSVIPILPTQIPGCQLWLDGADTTSSSMIFGSGSALTTWKDKSGNGANLTAVGGPTSTGNGVVFTAASSQYLSNTSFSFNLSSRTIFLACIGSAASTNQGILMLGQTGTADYDTINSLVITSGNNNIVYLTENYTASSPKINFNITSPSTSCILYTDTWSGTSFNMYNAGTSAYSYTENFTPTASPGIYVGARYDSAFGKYLTGTVFEIILYNTALSTSQRQQVEQYLGQKWAISVANAPSPGRYLIPFNRPFYPTDIPGCSLWLDAADRSSMTFSSGSNVSAWNDKSGNGNNGTANTGITWDSNGLGTGLPAMTFTNTQWFTGNVNLSGTSQLTSFCIYNMNASSKTNARVLSLAAPGKSDAGSNLFMCVLRYSGGTMANDRNSSFTTVNTTTGSNTLITSWMDGATSYISQGGGTPGTLASSGNFGISSYAIGNNVDTADTNAFFYGFIGEVIVFNTALSTPQRQQVEQYLTWKWGLPTANLPTGHPGKLLPAFSTAFTPKSIAGITLWLDAMDLPSMTFSTGSNISRWNDKSGNGNYFTVTEGTPSLSITTTTKSNPCILFPPNSQMLSVSNAAENGASSRTMIAVVDIAPSTQNVIGTGSISSPYIYRCLGFDLTQNSCFTPYVYGGSQDITSTPSLTSTTNIAYASYNSNTTTMTGRYGTGTADMTRTYTLAATSGPWYIGDRPQTDSGNTGFGAKTAINGRVCEFLDFNIALSTSQRQQVEGYLAWKWGLQSSLPSTHAYAKFSP